MARVQVALLRGVNVGGKNKVPMKPLREALVARGFAGVRTLIQSGNIVWKVGESTPSNAAQIIENILQESFSVNTPVAVLSLDKVRQISQAVPFEVQNIDPRFVAVGVCTGPPRAGAVLDPDRSPDDRFVLDGDVIYLHYTKGAARSKLSAAWFDRGLGTTTTFRNWRTWGKLQALAESLAS